ncbi:MAG: glycosyltransferase, partial [Elusimicrobiota bacterium]
MSQAPELSVVLPTLDEAPGLRVLLPRLKALFVRLGVRGEVLVIDGGSRDETTAVAAEHGARVLRQKGLGFGSAVREGLRAAGAEWVALMDADGSHAPEDLERFWARRQEARLIVGSRYCRGGSADMPLLRQVLSRTLNMVTRRVLDLSVRESSSGFRLYHGPSARAVPSVATDFGVQQDLLVGILAAGGRVVEEPIHYAPRVGGGSKANAWKLAPAYMCLLLRLKPLRGGWRAEAGLFCVLALGLATGLCGITGGLPGPARWRALPEGLHQSPVFARSLADSWGRLYQEIKKSHNEMRADEPRTSVQGVVEIAPGWTFPPDELVNAARALLTQSVNPDEKKSFIILAQMRPWRLEFKPLYAQYGGAFIYPLGAFLGVAHLLHLARLTPDLAYYLAAPEAMARLYLLGRFFTLFFHLGTLWLLYELGRILSGRRTGTVAALLWALAPVAIVNVHVLKPHPVAAFFFLAGAFCVVRAVEEGRWVDYLLAGLGMGLAAGGSLALGYGLAAPLIARACRREGPWRAPLLGTAVGLAVVIVTSPFLVFSPRDFAWELTIYSPSRFG